MNKDLDERLVPNGEYRDALNVEVATSEGSNVGSLQTIMGNVDLSTNVIDPQLQSFGGILNGYCVGSIADEQNDKLYWLISGEGKDIIAEYDYATQNVSPVVVDTFSPGTPPGNNSGRALNFNRHYLITGINIIDGILFWTDNHTEPKKVHIERSKQGSINFSTQTDFYVRSGSTSSQAIEYVSAGPIKHEHLTVIKKSPPTAPTLEMLSTTREDTFPYNDIDGEIRATITTSDCNMFIDPVTSQYHTGIININFDPFDDGSGPDYKEGDYIIISHTDYNGIKKQFRAVIKKRHTGINADIEILSGDPDLTCEDGDNTFDVVLEQKPSLFQFKFPRFGYRYKYEDGEYSTFSPFSEVAFIPGKFDYLPKEGYNLSMVNNLRSLAVKDFVHGRLIPEDVIAIDILYKESNSPTVYTVKTVKRINPSDDKFDEWNAVNSEETTLDVEDNLSPLRRVDMKTTGYVKIDSEMIHATLPSNQSLRLWDNVPRKALAQEVTGNRLVYANYLQNYNLNNSEKYKSHDIGGVGELYPTNSINVDLNLGFVTKSMTVNELYAEQINPLHADYSTAGYIAAKSIKTLRTYQLGVVYIDEFGRETPVFANTKSGSSSIYLPKDSADLEAKLKAQIKNTPPEWAKSFKFFIKETANEYYNLALDRWYDAEDGNIWLSFPSSERNKVDIETFLILKKEHDSDNFVEEPARYKILAIENEAPTFIKTVRTDLGEFIDDIDGLNATPAYGFLGKPGGDDGFPDPDENYIYLIQSQFEVLGWARPANSLSSTGGAGSGEEGNFWMKDPSDFEMRFKVPGSTNKFSDYYRVKSIEWEGPDSIGGPLGVTGWYKVTFVKSFGDDVGITRNVSGDKEDGIEVQLRKEEVKNRPEFEGRFFAKIKKDYTLITTIIQPSSSNTTTQWNLINQKKVQYINPTNNNTWAMDAASYFGNVDPTGGGTATDWAESICVSDRNGVNQYFSVGDPGVGETYWEDFADNTSGWFIDKIEGFRRFENTKYYHHGNDPGYNIDGMPLGPFPLVTDSGIAKIIGSGHLNSSPTATDLETALDHAEMQGIGISTVGYGSSTDSYLGINDNKGPLFQYTGTTLHDDQSIVGSVGIDDTSNVIHLSYSGVGRGNENTTFDANDTQVWNLETYTNLATDLAFINELTTPGTLWRWKEDPDQVVYKTIPPQPSGTYSLDEWNKNTYDIDGEPGIQLYNYATFYDYFIRDHEHYYMAGPLLFPGLWNRADHWHHQLVSQQSLHPGGGDHGGYVGPYGAEYTANFLAQNNTAHAWDNIGGDHGPVTPSASGVHSVYSGASNARHRYPMQIPDHNHWRNKRRRFMFRAVPYDDHTASLGSIGPSKYLPTNNPMNDAHFDTNGNVLTSTSTPQLPPTPAPGIRNDGMPSGHAWPTDPIGGWTLSDGTTSTNIPTTRMAATATSQSPPPGSVTWEIVTPYEYSEERFQSTNPAIFETEPKEDVDLDIYYEVGQIYPIKLDENNMEQFVGPVNPNISRNSKVTRLSSTGLSTISTATGTDNEEDIRVEAVIGNSVVLADIDGVFLQGQGQGFGQLAPQIDDVLQFTRSDGSITTATVIATPLQHRLNVTPRFDCVNGYCRPGDSGQFATLIDCISASTCFETSSEYTLDPHVHNHEFTLPWFNCFSFGNGVESNRVRDDYNQVTIDKGAKASTTLEEPYLEERRSSGLIYSGIYNSISGINNLNQFIQAEKITKDLNPVHGSIQKLFTRNTNLVTFCEDKVFKILANKDAVFNADGNPQLTATSNVLGQTIPFVGDYGISKNPESFASESYRAYFTDQTRGEVLRLSQDGITSISNFGMKDYFADNLQNTTRIIGSFDDRKSEYNITLDYKEYPVPPQPINGFLLANVNDECYWIAGFPGGPPGSIEPEGCGEYGAPLGGGMVLRIPISISVAVNDIVSGPGIPSGTHVTQVHTDLTCHNPTDGHSVEQPPTSQYPAGGHTLSENTYQDIRISSSVDVSMIDTAIVLENMLLYDSGNPLGAFPILWGHPMSIIITPPAAYIPTPATTVSFSEPSNGWVSFKSWHKENGISLNNQYYTFKGGQLWQHHANELRNNFYGDQYDTTVTVLFNESPGSVKSFHTLNYEGTRSRIWENLTDDEYWDNYEKTGWYVDEIYTNLQEGDIHQFKSKEDKWFSQIRGVETEWLDDGKAGNIDTREFSYQGIDEVGEVLVECGEDENGDPITGDDCYTSWNCQVGENGSFYCTEIQGTSGTYENKLECLSDPDSECKDSDDTLYSCMENGYCEPHPGCNGPHCYTTMADCHFAEDNDCTSPPYECVPDAFGNPCGYCVENLAGQYTGTPELTPEQQCQLESCCTFSNSHSCCGGVCVPDAFGPYISEEECIANSNCLTNDDPHDCNPVSGLCIPTQGGQYANAVDCYLNSPCGSETIWECGPDGMCMEVTECSADECYATEFLCLVNSTCNIYEGMWECECDTCIPSPTGTYATEADCLASADCDPGNPCSVPPSISHITTNPTYDTYSEQCDINGSVEVSVALTNGATSWSLEFEDAFGNIIQHPSSPFSCTNCTATYYNLTEGVYTYTVTDNLGCSNDDVFELTCEEPPPPPPPEACEEPNHILNTVNPTQGPSVGKCVNGEASVYMDSLNGNSTSWTIVWRAYNPQGNPLGMWPDPNTYSAGDTSTVVDGNPPSNFPIVDSSNANYKYFITTDTFNTDGTPCSFEYSFALQCDPDPCPESNFNATITTVQTHTGCDPDPMGNGAIINFVMNYTNNGSSTYNINWWDGNTYTSGSGQPIFSDTTDYSTSGGSVQSPPLFPDSGKILPQPNNNWYIIEVIDDLGCSTIFTEFVCCGSVDNPCGGGCIEYGCTDPSASNYNPLADCDDGSCCVDGCTDYTATNYDPTATCDDGSCVFDIMGCTDPLALNYNPSATIDDGSCIYCVYGCMDPAATNYDPTATCDDGSCIYPATFDCDGQGGCYDPGTGLGAYATASACQTACALPVFSWNCEQLPQTSTLLDPTNHCIDPGNGTGAFTDKSNCIDNCDNPCLNCASTLPHNQSCRHGFENCDTGEVITIGSYTIVGSSGGQGYNCSNSNQHYAWIQNNVGPMVIGDIINIDLTTTSLTSFQSGSGGWLSKPPCWKYIGPVAKTTASSNQNNTLLLQTDPYTHTPINWPTTTLHTTCAVCASTITPLQASVAASGTISTSSTGAFSPPVVAPPGGVGGGEYKVGGGGGEGGEGGEGGGE